jgi:hypothetical protein
MDGLNVDSRRPSHFANAIRKYGKDAFEHKVLETCETLEAANAAEERWIEQLGTRNSAKGFNLTRGGKHTPHPMRSPWDRPGFREVHQESVKRAVSTPEARLANSLRMKKVLSHPRLRQLASIRGKEIASRLGERERRRRNWRPERSLPQLRRSAAAERAKTHCLKGHEYSPENVISGTRKYRGSVYKTRICRTCFNARARLKGKAKDSCACGSPKKKSSKACRACGFRDSFGKNEKAAWPPLEELKALVETIGRSGIAKKLGVSFQAVTQKLKRHARHSAL